MLLLRTEMNCLTLMIRLAVLIILLTFAMPAFAHNPRVEGEDWGHFDAPYVVEDGAISFAFFAALAPGDDLDVYHLTFAEADRLRLELLIPVCGETYVDFYPRIFVLGAGDDPLTASDFITLITPSDDTDVTATPDSLAELAMRVGDFPDDLSLLYTYDSRDDEAGVRPIFYERHTRRDYYEAQRVDLDVKAGDITLVVYDPAGVGGDYLLASGYVEAFFPPLPSEPDGVTMDWGTSWPDESCN